MGLGTKVRVRCLSVSISWTVLSWGFNCIAKEDEVAGWPWIELLCW
jgi:hypothetical protein